ncbi:MAG TPA: hypothetical protein VNW29_06870 [Candidatus Sulfotelmatobacter sp.]|nr:hypothetical protein [Candidatus Sulfotelmatobacter sp.]
MIHRLHYRYLNSYLSLYFHRTQRRTFYKTKIINKPKDEAIEFIQTKTKLIGNMA